MPHSIMDEHPQLYRWLLRLLPVGAILTIALAAFAGWQVVSNITRNHNVTVRLRAQNAQQAATLRVLCDRGYIIDDVLEATHVYLRSQPRSKARDELLATFERDHLALIAQLTDPDSPCNR